MKTLLTLSFAAIVLPLAAEPAAPPADVKPPVEEKKEIPARLQAFRALPEEKREEFREHFMEGRRGFRDREFDQAIVEFDKAAAIFPDSPELLNLRAACHVEKRAFDKALADYEKSREFAPGNPHVDYNIGEVLFVTKEWKKSVESFDKALKVLPAENVELTRLVEFKVLICKKKLGQDAEVAELVKKHADSKDSPYSLYARAAMAFEEKDTAKAGELLAEAAKQFPDAEVLAPWKDTIKEMGYEARKEPAEKP